MGFKISWLAFSGKSKTDALASMNLVDTGVIDEANESPISVAEFPDGWTIFFLNPCLHPLTEEASLQAISADCTVLTGQVHEGIMYCSTALYQNGKMVWFVAHDAQNDMYDLQCDGVPPPALAEISAKLTQRQNAEGGAKAGVDYIFNVPVALAKSICGFEYSRWRYEWGEPKFTEVKGRDEIQ